MFSILQVRSQILYILYISFYNFSSLDEIPINGKTGNRTNPESLNVIFGTIDLQDTNNTTSEDNSGTINVVSSPESSPSRVETSPRASPRVSSACSEEITEAFQGQFLATLRTKNVITYFLHNLEN